jgi:hypothetical protein
VKHVEVKREINRDRRGVLFALGWGLVMVYLAGGDNGRGEDKRCGVR